MFENKKIFIIGLARSGFAIAKFLSRYTKDILVVDENEEDENIKKLESLGIEVIITDRKNQVDLLDDTFDFVIKNPGVPLKAPTVLKAEELGIPVINEIEATGYLLPKGVKIIGTTGSNGKTTVTTLLYEVLKNQFDNVVVAGNIGIPLSEVFDEINENTILVMEISDHQLANMTDFKVDISVLTNICEAHIDFWGTFEAYKASKRRIFNNHTENEIAIVNLDNEPAMDAAKNIKSIMKYFSVSKNTDCYLKDETIYYKNEVIINTKDMILRGIHNYDNAMVVIMVAEELGANREKTAEVIKNFKGIEHRNEYVKEINGRVFYNDSKSTNNAATITALQTFNEPTILILGGLDRGQNWNELAGYFENVKSIVCYGENKLKIQEALTSKVKDIKITDNLNEAVEKSYEISESGDVILLSPASGSWDQFKDFEERGKVFKEAVNKLR